MPPILNLDDYTSCLKETDGIYCTVKFAAISDEPSELLTMMQEYSKQYKTHYNHTSFKYGVCVTQKCKSYLGGKTEALTEALEEYLNETFWNEYKLKTQVTAYTCDGLDDGNIAIDTSDIVVGLILISLLILNLIGSLADSFFSKSDCVIKLSRFDGRVWISTDFNELNIKRQESRIMQEIDAQASTSEFYIHDPTFNELYVRGYTNLAASALGLIMGDLVYRWQLDEAMEKKIQDYKNLRLVYWSLLPLCFALIVSGKYFYMRPYLDPWYTRVLFSLTVPPLFTLFAAVLVVGFVFKFEDAYRSVFEWEGWTVPSRLSYSAYILHFSIIKYYTATKTSLIFVSNFSTMTAFAESIIQSLPPMFQPRENDTVSN
ncbi:uncharacterized protein [Epargyreus clarus]|uniref:uncharacterized protein n=1 Tax=Epargyreus clarus TaxID=520877 RepID=UPI003C3079DA